MNNIKLAVSYLVLPVLKPVSVHDSSLLWLSGHDAFSDMNIENAGC